MVSPSKKRQIKGRVTTGHKLDRKGEKASSKLPYKPLASKKFYLDIKSHKSRATITADILNLGGTVEEFLSREVSYVISTRGQQPAGGSSSEQQPSPSGALTPHQPLSSLPSTSHDSPLNLDSPREDTGKKRVRTRAEVLLERACVRRQGTSDVLENARLWNVPVWPLTKLLKWLTALKESGRYKPSKTNGVVAPKSSLSSSTKVTRLRAPFIKTEAFTRQYKPLYKELSTWPELNLFNPPGVSPFADPKQAKARQQPKSSTSALRNDQKDRRMRERARGAKARESGYCELCSTTYTNLTLHLKSDSHITFVRNDKNYLYLDELISGQKQNYICWIPMRYSGLMPPERPVASLSSNHPKRLRKQIVFKIGETIHSGPTLVAPAVLKDEDLITTSKCVFPSNLQESSRIPLDSDHLAQIPSTIPSSPQPSETPCFTGHTSLQSCTPCTQYYLGTKGSLPAAYVPDVLVPKIIVSKVSKTVNSAAVKSVGKSCTAEAFNSKRVKKAIVPKDGVDETCTLPVTFCKSAVPQCKSVEYLKSRPTLRSGRALERFENIHPVIKKEPDEVQDPLIYLNTIKDESFTSIESGMIELPERKSEVYEAIHPEFKKGRLLIKVVQRTTPTEAVVDSLDLSTNLSRASVIEENKEMVRLIQEADSKLDSFCPKRSSRASKRIGSAEFGVIEIKPEPVTRVRRCTRTRKCSCRSDKSESETSDSRSVADEALYFDMVDKTAKLGKPKNGEPLLDEATTHVSAKYNGDVTSEIANGAHKVKGRRVSRANSDESDSNSGSKSNGNIDHNGDKVDFSVLLEISPADRKKFESKKAKIRRKTADWLLISETEQYYNEKEEIMRNKNKLDSESESDESDTCTENQDSRSDCSDESESTAGSSRRNKGKGKPARTVEDDSRPSAKRPKEDLCSQKKRGRPVVSRTRKTLYDLTMLNDDDDDDDENFFGFPVSTTIPQSTRTSCTLSGSASQTRSKVKESCKHSFDLSSGSGKVGRKRLSDAERFLRDNREYYHFQETTERLRRSTSSSAEKEKTGRLDGCEVKEIEKKEESRLREPPPPPVSKKRPVVDGRRVTRSAGIILEEPDLQGKPKVKSVEKNDTKCTGKNVEKTDVKEKDKRKLPDDPKKKAPEEDKRKGCEGNKRKCVVESRRISSDVDKKESEDKKDSDVDKKVSEDKKDSDVRKTASESENRTSESIADCHESEGRTKQVEVSSCNAAVVSNSECTESRGKRLLRAETRETSRSDLQDLYFSFEGVPDQESWYQTYQRLVDGVCNNEFCYEEEPLKFVLPYEMPKEYVRDFLCYKKGMLAKKKNDLADLVRKSPRCHASTLALFSDIIPTKRVKNAKVLRSAPIRVEEASSDGTSTPGAESTKLPPPECFESTEELAILALHIDHIMKSEGCYEEVPVCNPHIEDLKESEGLDYKKTPPKKRGKKKRLMTGSKSEKSFENAAKELKLFDSSLAQEVDPVFIAGLCDDMKDFLIPENILAREASEVVEDSCFCVCTDRASCDEFSSADDNTEASSECVSLCDSETIDCSVVSEPKRGRSAKKRRKNLTGWPKTQKRKKPAPSHTSDDNDSALGWDDLEPKKHGCWKKQQDFSLLEQTTSERLAALAACDRRASPRKKASVLYMDTWPVRFRTQK